VGATMIGVACEAGLPVVWADHDRLEQVFVNLLSNALGHNPPGTRVRVTAAVDGAAVDGAAAVTVTVADDGAGMPADVALAPFEPTRRRRTPSAGAGLGLSIARGIVAAHGGSIELEQPEQGTCFRIQLPVEMPATQASGPRPATDGELAGGGPAGAAGSGTPRPGPGAITRA
jgi:signal transduction histidine kinase